MSITDETKGKMVLPQDGNAQSDGIAVMWQRGGDHIMLLQGGSGTVRLSKKQLIALTENAEAIANDIHPDMDSLPRS